MLKITDSISIDESELQFEFVRATGPGGQNVNKVASAVQLRFDLQTPSLPEEVRIRLSRLARKRISQEGILVIEARRFRSQEKNRQDAIDRLITMLRKAAVKPKARRKTHVPPEARRRRLDAKRRLSEKKRLRKQVDEGL